MLKFLRETTSDRKLRLFAVACCQTYRAYLDDERSWAAVEVASQVADGTVEPSDRERSFLEAYHAANWTYDPDAAAEVAAYTCGNRDQLNEVPQRVLATFAFDIHDNPRQLGYQLLRDIFINPFRLVSLNPSWLSSNVVDLARTIYEERAFVRLPILADALMDAGCENPDILEHCRGVGPHVRGCWVIDLLLGKE